MAWDWPSSFRSANGPERRRRSRPACWRSRARRAAMISARPGRTMETLGLVEESRARVARHAARGHLMPGQAYPVVACIGAGRMGRGIAHAFAYAGHEVRLIDGKPRDAQGQQRLFDETKAEIRSYAAIDRRPRRFRCCRHRRHHGAGIASSLRRDRAGAARRALHLRSGAGDRRRQACCAGGGR